MKQLRAKVWVLIVQGNRANRLHTRNRMQNEKTETNPIGKAEDIGIKIEQAQERLAADEHTVGGHRQERFQELAAHATNK